MRDPVCDPLPPDAPPLPPPYAGNRVALTERSVTGALLAKARFRAATAGIPLNERQRRMLERIADGFEGKLTVKRWQTRTGCSPSTARRDIADLVAKGLLTAYAAPGRRTGYAPTERALVRRTVAGPVAPSAPGPSSPTGI